MLAGLRAGPYPARVMPRFALFPVPVLLLAACQPPGAGTAVPGDTSDTRPYAGIAPEEVLHFTGTEPFWGGEVAGGVLTYATPENPQGAAIAVERFAGRAGLSFSGTLDGEALDMTVTQGSCSDGMSDRRYPFVVTLRLGGAMRSGCAWSDAHPFSGPPQEGR